VCEVEGAGERCLWPDIVLSVVYVLEQKGLFVKYIGSGLGYQRSSEQDLREWLGSIAEGSRREKTYLTRAFRRFAELYI
jgi:hypothetical protein